MLRLLILCLVACLVGKCQSQCEALEGSTVTWRSYPRSLYPNGTANSTEVTWTMNSGNSTTIISKCFSSGSCTNNFAPTFVASLTDRYSTLTATNVTRNLPFNVDGSLNCNWDTSFTYTACSKFYVIVKARSLSCVLLPVNATAAYVNCTIERSYPSSSCLLQVSRNNVSFTNYNTVVTNSMAATADTPPYFSGTCQMTLTDRFYLGTNYLRGVAYPSMSSNSRYYVYDEAFVYKTVFGSVGAVSSTSELGAVIGLAVATGIFGFVAAALVILIIVFWLRKKEKKKNTKTETAPPKISQKSASLSIPESYNKVDSPQLNSEDNYYEEVNNRKTTSGSNPRRLELSTPAAGMYTNSRTENSPSTSSVAANTKRLVQQIGMYTNSRTDKNQVKGLFRETQKKLPEDLQIEETYVNVEDYVNATT